MLQVSHIQFAKDYIAMDDDRQMLRAFVRRRRQERSSDRIHVGITENPVRRLQMHADHHMPCINVMVVRVGYTSSRTAAWETLAIKHLREHLRVHAVINRSEGGEGASAGIPHFGYVSRCR